LIKLAYTAYPTPASPPDAGWQQPTADMLEKGGPLVLKADSGGGTPPDPTPTPPATDYGPRFDAIDAQLAALVAQQANDTASIIMNDNANTEKIQTQIHDVIEDFEASAVKIGKLALLMRRINGGGSRSKGNDDAALDAAVADVEAWLATLGG
jgi:hypothetical protein